MKKSAKILSVVLAVLLVVSVIPMMAFAAEPTENEERVNGWKENYTLLLDDVFDNTTFTSWNYVDQNTKALKNQMNAMTAFALYDNAWFNAVDHNVSVEDAEKILLAIIEKAEYSFDDGYVDEITKVLEASSDVYDFIQKVNGIIDTDMLASSGWSTAFEVIGDVTYILNAYQNYRDQFIAAYANVLSVQRANAYYVDLLQYIVDNTEYDILKTAASNLIADINKSVEDVIKDIVGNAGEDYASIGVEYLVKLALNSNVYTAVAIKVYSIGTSIADAIWNTSDQYVLMDSLMAAYYFQANAATWAKEAYEGEDADKALIAVDLLLTTRATCEDVLYDLKLAQSDGIVGKYKNKLYGTVYKDTEINKAMIDTIRTALYDTAVADFNKVTVGLKVYCPVDVTVMSQANLLVCSLADGIETTFTNDAGIFTSVYSEYSKDYLKVVYLFDNYRVKLVGNNAGAVTLIMDVLNDDGTVADWSFTDVVVSQYATIVFNTQFEGTPYYTFSENDTLKRVDFNDNFVPSEQPEITIDDVTDATGEIIKEETKSFADMIKAFFASLFGWLTNLFKK